MTDDRPGPPQGGPTVGTSTGGRRRAGPPGKADVRAAARTRRRDPSWAAARAEADAAIRATLTALLGDVLADALADASGGAADDTPAGGRRRAVGLYAAMPGEVDVDGVVADLLAVGVPIALPRVVGPGHMDFRLVDALPREAVGTPPIREPAADRPAVVPAVVVVPGLAMDVRGGRLGHGGGFYDRWLAAHPQVRAIGVCRSWELVDRVPAEPHDIALQAVVTEGRVYR